MMNVLYLTANPNRASSNVPTEGWFRLLGRKGLSPVLVSSRSGAFQDWTQAQGIPTYAMPLPDPGVRDVLVYAKALFRLRMLVKRHRIQMVHAIEQNVYPIAADLARVCGLPVIVGVHCRFDRGFGEWAFGRWRQPDRLFFLTRGSREVCRPSVAGVVPETNWRLLYNGLDIEKFRPDPAAGLAFRDARGLGDGPLIGAASWLRPGKQIEHLIGAAAAVQDLDFTVVLAGGVAPGEEAYAKTLLESAQATLGSRLRYLGNLDDLRGFYNALDVYVNTSKEETCSISIMESLACGCPVVGYPSVSVDEQVLPAGGEILTQDDQVGLAGAIRRWLDDRPNWPARRRGARMQAVEHFDISSLADQLWREYESVVPSPKF